MSDFSFLIPQGTASWAQLWPCQLCTCRRGRMLCRFQDSCSSDDVRENKNKERQDGDGRGSSMTNLEHWGVAGPGA